MKLIIYDPNDNLLESVTNKHGKDKPTYAPKELMVGIKTPEFPVTRIIKVNSKILRDLMQNFETLDKFMDNIPLENIVEDIADPSYDLAEITKYRTYAYISDSNYFVVRYEAFYDYIFDALTPSTTQDDYISVYEFAKKYDKTAPAAKKHLRQKRVAGAKLIGNVWHVPSDAPWPVDKRFVTKK